MRLSLAGDVEPGREQPLVGAEPFCNSGGVARSGDHRIAGVQRGFRNQSAETTGSSCDEPDTHVLAPSVEVRRIRRADGQKLAVRNK
jgi:hypothetical protein